MFVIQNEKGWYLMSFLGAAPVWIDSIQEAKKYGSVEDAEPDERKIEMHHHLCWVVPA